MFIFVNLLINWNNLMKCHCLRNNNFMTDLVWNLLQTAITIMQKEFVMILK